MAERGAAPCADRSELITRLREELWRLEDPLEVVAERILGLEGRIDLVARDGRGQAVLVLVAESGSDRERLTDALAQRVWVEPRLADWLQLAPGLGLRPELGARALLLAPRFDARTRAAAAALGEHTVTLAELRWLRDGAASRLWIEAPGTLPSPTERLSTPGSRFRTGLEPGDL